MVEEDLLGRMHFSDADFRYSHTFARVMDRKAKATLDDDDSEERKE